MTSNVDNLRQSIATLTDLARGAEPTDLPQLAKMHEHIQSLGRLGAELPENARELFQTLCRQVADEDERIILDECADPVAALERIRRAVERLGELAFDESGAADVAINPMATGSGTNLKIVEYLAAGVPVVTSTVGVSVFTSWLMMNSAISVLLAG